jgi:hypothetical protein
MEPKTVIKCGSIIVSQRVKGREWTGNMHNHTRKGSKANNLCRDFWDSQGTARHSKAQYRNIIRAGAQQETAIITVRCNSK